MERTADHMTGLKEELRIMKSTRPFVAVTHLLFVIFLTPPADRKQSERDSTKEKSMNSKCIVKAAGLMGLVFFGVSALHGKPLDATSERNRSIAEQAKSMMASNKKLHDSVVAAIKAKNTAKVQSLFAKAGLNLPAIRFSTNQCCVVLPGGNEVSSICCD
jgi:hypothetical protein